MNDHFTTSLLIHLNYPTDVVNLAIVIIFNTAPKLLGKRSQSGIALTFFIEIVDKELLKYEVENIGWWYMTDKDGKQ